MQHPSGSTFPDLKKHKETNEDECPNCNAKVKIISMKFCEKCGFELKPGCNSPKISKEDGFYVCLNCGFVYSRILLEPGWGDPTLQEDDPWVEKCGYYNREKFLYKG